MIRFRIKPNHTTPSGTHDGFFGIAEWPYVPRVGERITFDPDGRVHGEAVVRGVTYDCEGQPTVDLYLHRAIDKDIQTLKDWGFVTYKEWNRA